MWQRLISTSVVFHGKRTSDRVALTFDDGPHPETTPLLLNALEKHGARATFFVLGTNARANPDVTREIVKRGHELAGHSFWHRKLLWKGRDWYESEIDWMTEVLQDISAVRIRYFRPPFGVYGPVLVQSAARYGLTTVMWDVNSKDYKRKNPADIARKVLRRTRPGSIVLFHDRHFEEKGIGYGHTVQALDTILPELSRRGLKAVTVGELLHGE